MADTVILGAGLTGLSTAYHLEQQGIFSYKIFEKETTTGGLCRSVTQDGFTFDYTGHLLHCSDPYFYNFLDTVVGFNNLNSIDRRASIYAHERYIPYPYQNNLQGLPPEIVRECLTTFVQKKHDGAERSFYSWAAAHFGAGIARHFFYPYQKKIFDYDVRKLSSSWTGRFVPQTTLHDIVTGAVGASTPLVGYNAHFWYPKTGGIFFWIDKLHQQLKNPVASDYCVKAIDSKEKKIIFTNGHQESYKKLVTTLPLDTLLSLLITPSNSTLARAGGALRCAQVINFNLGINHPSVSDRHWIYYPEMRYPFYRLGFHHNFSRAMAPAGCSALYGELALTNKPMAVGYEKLQEALRVTKKLFHLSERDIVTEKIIHIKHAYVIFNQWRDTHVPTIVQQLAAWDIYSIGRYGGWKYSSMQEGLLDGKQMAEQLAR